VAPRPVTSVTSFIPFPSSSPDTLNSQSDPTCLPPSSSETATSSKPHTCVSPSGQPQSVPERRKRATARLCRPVVLPPKVSAGIDSNSQVSDKPPRKRPRLQKGAKSTNATSSTCSSELRFMAMLQRTVACGVLERRAEEPSRDIEPPEREVVLETQDRLFASRLRSHLISQGVRENDVVELDGITCSADVDPLNVAMDIDVEGECSPSVSVDMDIDVEPSAKNSPPSLPASPQDISHRSPSTSPRSTSTPPKLVAALIMRHKDRSLSRSGGCSQFSSEREGVVLGQKRTSSPLARFEPLTASFQEDGLTG
jgi:hypothetical protein